MLKKHHWSQILLLILLILLLYGGWQFLPIQQWSLEISQFAEKQGTAGIVFYGLVFVLATVFLIPCAFLTFAAGVAYGAWGLPLILVATSIGSTIAFLIARYFAKEKVTQYMQKRPATRALKTAIESEGWKFMMLFRISPLIPFNLNSYFLGTVKIRFATFFWVTLFGALPGTGSFIYLGMMGRNLHEQSALKWIVLILGLIATYFWAHVTLKKTKELMNQTSKTT